MKGLFQALIDLTRPWVQRLATAYDLRVDRHCVSSGQLPLTFEDPRERLRDTVPKSVRFNTRSGSIRVGRNTVFGEDVMVLTGKHVGAAHVVPEGGRDIEIGRDCFIGSGAIIVGPARIGDGAIIGAGSVVTHDVPAGAFAAGVPARVIRSSTGTGSSTT